MTEPTFRPDRERFVVHAGGAHEEAVLPEWWGAVDSPIESRAFRFPLEGGNWIDADELPPSLVAAGCRRSQLVGSDEFARLADPALAVGRRVLLAPQPPGPGGTEAIGVWVEDSSGQVGFVTPSVAAETMAGARQRGSGYGAIVIGEERDKGSGARTGLTLLLGPGRVWAERLA